MLLLRPEQIELTGNHVVTREAVLKQFVEDRNRSVLRMSLDLRRSQLEQIPWIESATVERILPNRIRIELTERTPIAFVRNGDEVALISVLSSLPTGIGRVPAPHGAGTPFSRNLTRYKCPTGRSTVSA